MKKTATKRAQIASSRVKDEMLIIVGDSEVRGWGRPKPLKLSELSLQLNVFIGQMGEVLSKTPTTLGDFRFEEVEIQAEITAKGSLALLGTGGEAGATGGIKFVFKRAATQGQRSL